LDADARDNISIVSEGSENQKEANMAFSEHNLAMRLVRVEDKLESLSKTMKDTKEEFEKKLTEAIQSQVISEREIKGEITETNKILVEMRDKMSVIRFALGAVASVAMILLGSIVGAFAKFLFDTAWK
jgi:hypothetical protein